MMTSLLAAIIFFTGLSVVDDFADISARSQLAEVGATGGANYGGDWGSGSSDSDVGPVGDPGFGPTGSYDGGGQAQGGGPSGEPSGGGGSTDGGSSFGNGPDGGWSSDPGYDPFGAGGLANTLGGQVAPSYESVGRSAGISSSVGQTPNNRDGRDMEAINANWADLAQTISNKTQGLVTDMDEDIFNFDQVASYKPEGYTGQMSPYSEDPRNDPLSQSFSVSPGVTANPTSWGGMPTNGQMSPYSEDPRNDPLSQSFSVSPGVIANEKTDTISQAIGAAKAALDGFLTVPDQYDVADEVTALEKAVAVGKNLADKVGAYDNRAIDRIAETAFSTAVDTIIDNANRTQNNVRDETNIATMSNATLNAIDSYIPGNFTPAVDALDSARMTEQYSNAAAQMDALAKDYKEQTGKLGKTEVDNINTQVTIAGMLAAQAQMVQATAYFDAKEAAKAVANDPTTENINALETATAMQDAALGIANEINEALVMAEDAIATNNSAQFNEAMSNLSQFAQMAGLISGAIGATSNTPSISSNSIGSEFADINADIAASAVANGTISTNGVAANALSNALSDAYGKNGQTGVYDKAAEIEAAAQATNPDVSISVSPLSGGLGFNVDINDGRSVTSATVDVSGSLNESSNNPSSPNAAPNNPSTTGN